MFPRAVWGHTMVPGLKRVPARNLYDGYMTAPDPGTLLYSRKNTHHYFHLVPPSFTKYKKFTLTLSHSSIYPMPTPDFLLWHFIQKDDIKPAETTVSEDKV